MKLKTLLLALAFVLLPVVSVHAEDGLTQCFDYYKFGSVQVDVAPVNRDALAGTDLTFSGSVHNQNNYPIVDGAVYVKIFRRDPKGNTQANGWELVDQFFAKKGLNIDGKKSLPVSFDWKAPAYLVGGDYKVATFFVTQDRFNLSGLSFTDDIIGTSIPFRITSEQTKSVSFDRNAVKVGEKKHLFASFTAKMGKSEPVKITFDLANTFATQKVSQLTYTLYSWDGLRADQIIDTKKETVIIPANGRKTLSYTVTDAKSPVYLLVVESKSDDAKSIIDVRFARQGIEKARLNFPALATYPLVKGAEATMFSCFHNAGLGEVVPNGKVVMTLKDSSGFVIDKYTYTGEITGAVMGIKKSFVPKKNFNNVTLTTELFVDDKLVETSHTKYKCEELNQALCAAEAMEKVGTTSRTMMYIVIGVAVLVLLVAILAYHGHLKRKDVGVASFIFLGTISIGMYQLQAKLVDAAILSQAYQPLILEEPSNVVTGQYYYSRTIQGDLFNMAVKDLSYSTIAIYNYNRNGGPLVPTLDITRSQAVIRIRDFMLYYNYGAQMKNALTDTEIPEGSTIPIGTRIKFVPAPFTNNHIGWHLTGSTLDTPFAYWNDGVVPKCQPADQFAAELFTDNVEGIGDEYASINAYLPIIINRPAVSINTTGGSAGLVNNGDGTYTVTSPGTIRGEVVFAPTLARAIMQYDVIPPRGWASRPGPCSTFNTFEFYTDEKEIVFNANAGDTVGNRLPPPPNFTTSGQCQNVPLNVNVSPVTDPDGDPVSYQYAYSTPNSGGVFTGWQTIPNGNIGFGLTPTNTGQYVIRVRATDNKGEFSAYTSKTVTVTNCSTISMYCLEPTFVGDAPQWQVSAYSSNQSITYTYNWSWTSRSYTTPQPNTLLSSANLAPGGRMSGPSVTVTPSVGASQRLNCPEANREPGGGGSSNPLSATCELDAYSGGIPTWKVFPVGGRSPYTYTWGQPSLGTANGDRFTFGRAVTSSDTIDNITVNVRDARGADTGEIACEGIDSSPSVELLLSDISGRKRDEVVVKQNQTAFAYTATNKIIPSQCIATKAKTTGVTSNASWGLTNVNFSDYDAPLNLGLASLNGYPLDTTVVGEFQLDVTCPELGNASNTETSSAILRVVVDPDLKEF